MLETLKRKGSRDLKERIHHEIKKYSLNMVVITSGLILVLLRLKWFYLISPFTEYNHSMQTTKDHMKVA